MVSDGFSQPVSHVLDGPPGCLSRPWLCPFPGRLLSGNGCSPGWVRDTLRCRRLEGGKGGKARVLDQWNALTSKRCLLGIRYLFEGGTWEIVSIYFFHFFSTHFLH